MHKYKGVKIFVGDDLFCEYKINYIKNNIIVYKDDSCINKIELLDDKYILTRENEEFLLIIDNLKEFAYYKLKELNYELDIKINYIDKYKKNANLIISYQLETNDKEIKIMLEGE